MGSRHYYASSEAGDGAFAIDISAIAFGGGSVMDTAKAANPYATYPADFLTYVNAPSGGGEPVPGPPKPHIACPTTAGAARRCMFLAAASCARSPISRTKQPARN